MSKPLFLFVGKSASGKTTVANMLEKDGCTQIQSYTTRPRRYENETGHTFITDDEYDQLKDIVASTTYNNYRYCTTLEQIQNADISVVDVQGVKTLFNNYHLLHRQVHIVFFAANTYNRIQRMLERGDNDTQIISRLLTDEKEDWLQQIGQVTKFHNWVEIVDANLALDKVYDIVKKFIKRMEISNE